VAFQEDDGRDAEAEGRQPTGAMDHTDHGMVAGDDGSVVPLAEGLPDTGGATLRDLDPAYGRRDVTGTPAQSQDRDEASQEQPRDGHAG
jgi:hypothetical protein